MPAMINQPSNQVKLTNVSLVRLKKGKKRFEIACYKNKVLEYRSGIESNLDEVLQIPSVFLNVSKGQTAPSDELKKAFGPDKSVDDIVLEILQKGELQVGEKERSAQLERLHNEVVDIVAGKLVDPQSKRVYTVGMIGKALEQLSSQSARERQEEAEREKHRRKEGEEGDAAGGAEGERREKKAAWTGVSTSKSAKSLALEAMKALIAWQPIPVARARMKLKVVCHVSVLKQQVKAAPAKGAEEGDGAASKKKGGKGKGGKKGGGPAEVQAAALVADTEDGEGEKKAAGTVKEKIMAYIEEVENQGEVEGEWEITGFVEPGAFKPLSELMGNETRGKGRVEVLDMAVTHED
ncbi:MAG: hypothetical protein MMC23_004354 [Stictis urceolatum]|nr:hypothetical protein [Stictis urceolata]